MAKFLNYNVIMSYTMSMYKIDSNSRNFTKFLFYLWRVICNVGLISGMVLSIAEIFKKDSAEISEMAVEIMNSGVAYHNRNKTKSLTFEFLVIFFSSTMRINYFYFHEDKLEEMVETINNVFKRQTNTGFEEKTMESYDKFTRNLVTIWCFSVFFTGEFMALLPLLFIHKTGRILPLPLWYPYDWKKSPNYELTYFTQALTQFFMGFSYGNSDMFFACIASVITSQFEFLGWELKYLVYTTLLKQNVAGEVVLKFKKWNDGMMLENDQDELSNDEIFLIMSTEKFKTDLKNGLNACIKYHQVIVKTCDDMQAFFSPILLPAMIFSISYCIFIMYSLTITTANTSVTVSLLEYLMMAYAQIFCLTFMGQQLYDMSESVLISLYEMPWYLCGTDFGKTLHIMQTKLLKPTTITAWKFFGMILTTFLFAMKTSFSYVAFLRQVSENERK